MFEPYDNDEFADFESAWESQSSDDYYDLPDERNGIDSTQYIVPIPSVVAHIVFYVRVLLYNVKQRIRVKFYNMRHRVRYKFNRKYRKSVDDIPF